jgi:hypothetical protein
LKIKTITTVLVALLAVATIAIGCGGDDSGNSEDGASATAPAGSTSPEGSKPDGAAPDGSGADNEDSGSGGSGGAGAGGGSGGAGSGGSGESSANGSDSGGDNSTAPSKDKVRFLKLASAICRKTRSNLNREGDEFVKKQGGKKGGKKSPQEVFGEVAQKVLLPAIEDENAAIAKLKPPTGEAGEVEAILSVQRDSISEMRSVLKNPATLQELERPFDKANEKFSAYGLTACVM